MVSPNAVPAEQNIEPVDRRIGRSIFIESELMTWEWQQDGLLNSGVHEIAEVWTYEDGFERTGIESHQITLASRFTSNELTWQYIIGNETSRSIIHIDVKRDGTLSGWRADYTNADEPELVSVRDLKKPKQIERLWRVMKGLLLSIPAEEQRSVILDKKQSMQDELDELRLRLIGMSTVHEAAETAEKVRLHRAIIDTKNNMQYAGFKKASLHSRPVGKDMSQPAANNPLTEAQAKLLDPLFLKFISLKSLLETQTIPDKGTEERADPDPVWQYERYGGNQKNLTAMGQMRLFIDWRHTDKDKNVDDKYYAVEYVGWNESRPSDESINGLKIRDKAGTK